jgi:hypothetical protein
MRALSGNVRGYETSEIEGASFEKSEDDS